MFAARKGAHEIAGWRRERKERLTLDRLQRRDHACAHRFGEGVIRAQVVKRFADGILGPRAPPQSRKQVLLFIGVMEWELALKILAERGGIRGGNPSAFCERPKRRTDDALTTMIGEDVFEWIVEQLDRHRVDRREHR